MRREHEGQAPQPWPRLIRLAMRTCSRLVARWAFEAYLAPPNACQVRELIWRPP